MSWEDVVAKRPASGTGAAASTGGSSSNTSTKSADIARDVTGLALRSEPGLVFIPGRWFGHWRELGREGM